VHPTKIYQPSPSELAITWQGGSESRISTKALRINCPCSECRSAAHRTSATYLPLLTGEAMMIREIDLIGSSALKITWEDGHSMGIYRYSYLRELAPPREPGE
jgi:DUF971 family protein